MRRRQALAAVSFLTIPMGARAQPAAKKVYRIAVFDAAPVSDQHPNALAFFDELRRLGYVRGENLVVERRDAGGQQDMMSVVARELVAWRPDLVVASTAGPNLAMKSATTSIPILMNAVGDPVTLGLVDSLAHPGGNVTGITFAVAGGLDGKVLQLLQEAVPRVKRLALFVNDSSVHSAELNLAAQHLGIELLPLQVRQPDDIQPGISAAQRQRCQAVFVYGGGVLARPQIAQAVTAAGLPLLSTVRLQTEAGGLLSYGPDFPHLYRRAAVMADRLLKGVPATEIPVEQPTKFELVVNLKTAERLGIAIPRSVLLRADEVIR